MTGVSDPFDRDLLVDSNGCLAERSWVDGREVIIHYDDVPESDITTLGGIRLTTPLRTVIDIAPDVDLSVTRPTTATVRAPTEGGPGVRARRAHGVHRVVDAARRA